MAAEQEPKSSSIEGRGADEQFATAQDRIQTARAAGSVELNLSDLSELRTLPNEIADLHTLQYLTLYNTRISDLTPIAHLSLLHSLHLERSRVSDLSPLARLTNLQLAALETPRGLHYALTPVALRPPFDYLVRLDQPARTVETINELRRQHGLPAYLPVGYERPAEIDDILGSVEAYGARPSVPQSVPAALEPVLSNGRISLPIDAAAADLGDETRDAALSALKIDLEELAIDVEGEANIDRRAAKLLRDVGALVPQTGPPQYVLFRLAHKEEVLVAYAPTVNKEWPEILAGRYHVVCRQFDRTMRQFPKWREFKRNAAKDRFTPEQLAKVPPIAGQAIDALAHESTEPFVDPKVPQSLEELTAPLRLQQHGDARDIVEASKELLVEDVVESINNVLKRVAEVALAAGSTGKETVEVYAEGLANGLVDAAKKQGPRDGAALFKWARRFLITSGGVAAAGAFIQRLIQVFPEKFAWLDAVLKFLAP